MTLVDAAREYREAKRQLGDARTRLNAEIIAAARAGVMQRDIVTATGLTREWVRQICRAAGITAE